MFAASVSDILTIIGAIVTGASAIIAAIFAGVASLRTGHIKQTLATPPVVVVPSPLED